MSTVQVWTTINNIKYYLYANSHKLVNASRVPTGDTSVWFMNQPVAGGVTFALTNQGFPTPGATLIYSPNMASVELGRPTGQELHLGYPVNGMFSISTDDGRQLVVTTEATGLYLDVALMFNPPSSYGIGWNFTNS